MTPALGLLAFLAATIVLSIFVERTLDKHP